MRNELSCKLSQRRIYTTSYWKSMVSIVHLHLETINIWSHLFGTLWFCASATRFAGTAMSLFSPSTAAILAYLTANVFCFACSTLYHVFADHAEADFWLRLDHLGIVWASSISFVALSFSCHFGEQYAYTIFVTAAAALCTVRILGNSQHSCSERRSRICTYVALGSLATLPAFRCWYLGRDFGLLTAFGMLVVINTSGGAIYATQILDKAIKMKLGVPGASHYTMHVLAVVRALVYEQGLLLASKV
jgi:adiponectin receptor